MTPFDPYAPPAVSKDDEKAVSIATTDGNPGVHRPWLKWIYLAAALLSGAGWIGAFLALAIAAFLKAPVDDEPPPGIPELIAGLTAAVPFLMLCGMAFFLLRIATALLWIYGAWLRLPWEYQRLASGKRTTPGRAVGFLFIPIYGLYWMFAMSFGLGAAFGRLRPGAYAPKYLAISAVVSEFVPVFQLCVAPVLWFLYMRRIDSLAEPVE